MRELTTSLDNMLSLIACASTYGYERDVLFDAFADMMDRKLSFEEIELHAKIILEDKNYGVEDYESIKEELLRFKSKYIDEE